ncbi:MAG: cupin domain-containing protein [Gammaproteobacteria bacterium]|nr:cupin domain-containing protein [Gammaproteobacteria bacterium]
MDKSSLVTAFHLQTTDVISPTITNNVGKAFIVDKNNFAALAGVTCYALEVWDASMRLPHWHPNASELGYVVSGTIEVIIWRSPGESAVFTLSAGMCWFIPQAALHSLNNVGDKPAQLFVGFSSDTPQDIDLPVAFNGIPAPLRDAYTSPHTELLNWQGTTSNPLVGKFPPLPELRHVLTASPYGFDLAKVTPLFDEKLIGSVVWGIQSNWAILENISILRAKLKPNVARDAIWYPDVGTLYVVAQGTGTFHLIMAGSEPTPIAVKMFDYFYVPAGFLHTFINTSNTDFEVIAFFTKANPQPEVSLSVATSFFPDMIRQAAMMQYGNLQNTGDPLKHLNFKTKSPYLIPLKSK